MGKEGYLFRRIDIAPKKMQEKSVVFGHNIMKHFVGGGSVTVEYSRTREEKVLASFTKKLPTKSKSKNKKKKNRDKGSQNSKYNVQVIQSQQDGDVSYVENYGNSLP
eukprot:272625_1